MKLPAEFKLHRKKYGKDFNAFYIVSREGEDAEIYPMPEWQQHLAKVFKLPKSLPARKKLLESYTLYGDRADMDPQGRIADSRGTSQRGLGECGSQGFRRGHSDESEEPESLRAEREGQSVSLSRNWKR